MLKPVWFSSGGLSPRSVIYDLPFGRGKKFGNTMWKPLDLVAGGWTVSALNRISSGFPYVTYLSDTNQLGDLTHTARPNIISGVPLVNPAFNINCPTGTNCQPYLNPSAFERPALGSLGTAPRTLDSVRGPWQPFLDMSPQKSFKLTESGKYRVQFRVDALNVFNQPRVRGLAQQRRRRGFHGRSQHRDSADRGLQYLAAYNNQPLYSATGGTPGNVLYNNIVTHGELAEDRRCDGGVTCELLYRAARSQFPGEEPECDITTLNGYKQYQLKSAYGTNFGTLYNSSTPHYIQLGLKIYF